MSENQAKSDTLGITKILAYTVNCASLKKGTDIPAIEEQTRIEPGKSRCDLQGSLLENLENKKLRQTEL